jgi:hypothetical protein
MKKKKDEPKALKSPGLRTCADCCWARWPHVWYAQTGACQIKRREYTTRKMEVCTMYKKGIGK